MIGCLTHLVRPQPCFLQQKFLQDLNGTANLLLSLPKRPDDIRYLAACVKYARNIHELSWRV